jgi:hypothetical protein
VDEKNNNNNKIQIFEDAKTLESHQRKLKIEKTRKRSKNPKKTQNRILTWMECPPAFRIAPANPEA